MISNFINTNVFLYKTLEPRHEIRREKQKEGKRQKEGARESKRVSTSARSSMHFVCERDTMNGGGVEGGGWRSSALDAHGHTDCLFDART